MGQRDLRCGCRAVRSGNARYDLHRNARSARRLGFLAAAPEDERIATLEAHGRSARLRLAHQQRVDIFLRHAVMAAPLGDRNQPCIGPREGEDGGIDEPVMNDDFRLLDQPRCAQRQEIGIAGACAHEVNGAGFCHAGIHGCSGRGARTRMVWRRPSYSLAAGDFAPCRFCSSAAISWSSPSALRRLMSRCGKGISTS